MTLADWGAWGAIIAASIAVIGSSIGIIKFFRHKYLLNNPATITYLIPQCSYPCASFIGAPDIEKKPRTLTVGVGKYLIMFELSPRVDISIDELVPRFKGIPIEKTPINWGKENPYIVSHSPGVYKDWWGDYQSDTYLDQYPRYVYKGDCLVIGSIIETTGEWEGEVYFELRIRNEKIVILKLDFLVSKKFDEIPFLKDWKR